MTEIHPIPPAYVPSSDALKDRVVLVTGAGDGIGRAVALECAKVGATVVLLGRTQSKLESTYDAIEKLGAPRPAILPLDLGATTVPEFGAVAASLEKEYGRIDGIAHVAGVLGARTPLEQYDSKVWSQVLAVNLTAPFLLTQALLPLLRESHDPAVVFASSSVGRKGRAFWGAYAVSKSALEGLMQVWADESSGVSRPIRMNSLNPGPVRTAMRLEAYPGEDRDTLTRPEQVAPAFVYLLSPDGAAHTGQAFDAQPR
jgi:NAD(P)-dependent dehydrogenase (short-subunit alcohol dehydrogenase family)